MNSSITSFPKSGIEKLKAFLRTLPLLVPIVCWQVQADPFTAPLPDGPPDPRVEVSSATLRSGVETVDKDAVQARVGEEAAYALQFLNALDDDISGSFRHYTARIRKIVDDYCQGTVPGELPTGQSRQLIVLRLEEARKALLESLPTVQEWRRLARIVTPEGPLRTPSRFIHRRPIATVELDTQALDAAAWASSLLA